MCVLEVLGKPASAVGRSEGEGRAGDDQSMLVVVDMVADVLGD